MICTGIVMVMVMVMNLMVIIVMVMVIGECNSDDVAEDIFDAPAHGEQ